MKILFHGNCFTISMAGCRHNNMKLFYGLTNGKSYARLAEKGYKLLLELMPFFPVQ